MVVIRNPNKPNAYLSSAAGKIFSSTGIADCCGSLLGDEEIVISQYLVASGLIMLSCGKNHDCCIFSSAT